MFKIAKFVLVVLALAMGVLMAVRMPADAVTLPLDPDWLRQTVFEPQMPCWHRTSNPELAVEYCQPRSLGLPTQSPDAIQDQQRRISRHLH